MQLFHLKNGLQVVTEKIPHFRSFSIGFWIGAGSCAETEENSGISHFIEHMLFKGTQKRTAKQIAGEIDALGGQLNAFTAKECTCFYVNLLDEHYNTAIDLLCDILQNSKLAPEEIEREKGVVCEEISMVDDTPDELAHELLAKAYYGSHPLGKPILGTRDTVNSFTQQALREYMGTYYIPSNMVISVAGNFDEEKVLFSLEERIGSLPAGGAPVSRCDVAFERSRQALFAPKEIEQINMCLGFAGAAQVSGDLYPQLVINNLFGGGMSSRLFQRVREQNGLTYSIYSYPTLSTNSGIFTIYAGMSPNQAMRVHELVTEEINLLKSKGIGQQEFIDAREQLKGSFILGMESASAIMNRNGKAQLLQGNVKSQDEIISLINGVTIDQVHENIQKIFDTENICASLVGKVKDDDALLKILRAQEAEIDG